ncbi:helix-turn-helix domain-containing protein [Oceanobacillus sp. Castelsardo]|uniref:helix-turn-helix domain-containing protein n=1 Tax=Oceanobacillus sp. Castelsardo TaxID=1851204 RepID=UPI0008384D7B|nr:helix-turn-helix transcriptional regulator [Oceanobacillus sp. Castelsardo]
MTVFAKRLKTYREKLKKEDSKWTQKYVADKIGLARVTYTAYENGTKMPPFDTINRIAELFDIKTDYLMGRTDNPKRKTTLSEKDEKDIAKRMEKMKRDLIEGNAEGEGLSYRGEPMSPEAIESLLEALEHAERIATLANKKYTPKKYRDKE